MVRIRREQFEIIERRQRERQRAALVAHLTADDDKAQEDPNTGDVVFEDSRGNRSRLQITGEGIVGLKTTAGREYRLARNKQGRVASVHAPNDCRLDFDYTPDGLLSQVNGNRKRLLKLDYSDNGNSLDATFADDAHERLEFQPDAKLARTVNALGGETSFNYNFQGNIAEIRDARGSSTKFDYDDEGYPVSVRFADGHNETYDVAQDGRLEISTDGKAHSFVAINDENAIEGVEFADGHHINFKSEDGIPLEGANANHVAKFEYGDSGLLVKEEQDGEVVEYQYDGEDNLVQLTTPTGDALQYAYDGDDLLREIRDWDGRIFRFSHDAAGQISRVEFPNGVVTTIETSQAGEDQTIRTSGRGTAQPIVDDVYTYDDRGRVSLLRRQGELREYVYDAAGQLTSVRHSEKRAESFAYDASSNRIQCNGAAAEFDPANKMRSQGSDRFDYDPRGNLVSRTGSTQASYSYNGQDHLVRAKTTGNEEARYTYDAFGRRLTKSVGDTKTQFIWAGRQLVREVVTRGEDTVEERDYLYMPGEHFPIAVRINGKTHCCHTDRLGTVLALTDPDGQVVWSADYDAFGKARITVSDVRQPLRFLGQYHDDETDLHYNLFRYYDPRLGRYLTQDPIRHESGSLNFYQFANNDPVNRSDPEGHLVFLTAVAIIAGAALIGGLIGGAISAATAPEGEKLSAFGKGFGWGALAGAVGAAVPIIGAAAGLGTAAIAGIAVAADAVIGGIEACAEGGSFLKGAGISLAMTVGTLGLAKIPGVKRALGAVGTRLGGATDKMAGKLKSFFSSKKVPTRGTQAGHGYARKVHPGGNGNSISGHAELRPGAGTFEVPEGTTLIVPKDGIKISDTAGRVLETIDPERLAAAGPRARKRLIREQLDKLGIKNRRQRNRAVNDLKDVRVMKPGDTVENYTVKAPDDLEIHEASTVVEDPTPLSDVVSPNSGTCTVATCTESKKW